MLDLLRDELTRAGLAPEGATRRRIADAITGRGRKEFDRLRTEAGLPMECVERSAVDCLGRGAAITEFAAAPIGLAPGGVAEAGSIGALAALIASGFDAILDSGSTPPEIALRPGVQPNTANGPLKHRILGRLVEIYYERLNALPHHHAAVRAVIDTAIRRMYAAELQSADECKILRATWWRKNALPFVAMTSPGWLSVADANLVAFRRHLRWVCRLGEFLGWIDDCADLDRDWALDQPNRIRIQLGTTSRGHLAARISSRGTRVLREWRPATGAGALRETLAVTVWSWIEKEPV